MKFFLCCRSGYSGSRAQQQPPEKSRLLVATEAHLRVGRKRRMGAGERRCGVIDWRPSLSSISEDNILSERVIQRQPQRRINRKGGGASISHRDRALSSHHNNAWKLP
ncbi:unnamed protein product [Fraxinus pennsylvanica]|uniref:Uncharacterized protein n=1 Tax=Fraxinus pennsylvanica TaxID=56036 RepID=A0AAD2DK39_9LAMI|nr:unnamed protein product [Fraxinus pennsylvanica]